MELEDILEKLKGNTVNLILIDKSSEYSYDDIKKMLSDNPSVIIADNGTDEAEREQRAKIRRETKVMREVSGVLKYIGMTPNIKGFTYISNAVCHIVISPEHVMSITKIVYPEVAKKYKTTSSCVERAIRHAIETTFSRPGTRDKISVLMGYCVTFTKTRPSNAEFIALISDYVRTKYSWNL